MNRTSRAKRWRIIPLAACLFLTAASVVLAQSGGDYDLSWSTVDGGGGKFSTGGVYALGGTIGQADVGSMSGGGYTLAGGFWSEAVSVPAAKKLYLPMINR